VRLARSSPLPHGPPRTPGGALAPPRLAPRHGRGWRSRRTPCAARPLTGFLFKAFETGQIGPRRLERMLGANAPRNATIHEYLDWVGGCGGVGRVSPQEGGAPPRDRWASSSPAGGKGPPPPAGWQVERAARKGSGLFALPARLACIRKARAAILEHLEWARRRTARARADKASPKVWGPAALQLAAGAAGAPARLLTAAPACTCASRGRL
jgi:hypothetical protein